jgi:hypothetical protein
MSHIPSSLSRLRIPTSLSRRMDRPQCRVGVLLVNLGTPDGTGYWAIRRYLNEFLSDPRVIEVNSCYGNQSSKGHPDVASG